MSLLISLGLEKASDKVDFFLLVQNYLVYAAFALVQVS